MDAILPYKDTLAAAYAESGQFSKAVALQKQVIRSLIDQEKTDKLDQYAIRLKQYEAGQPWRFKVVATRSAAKIKKGEQPPPKIVAEKGAPLPTESQAPTDTDTVGTEVDTAIADRTLKAKPLPKKVSLKYLTRKEDSHLQSNKTWPSSKPIVKEGQITPPTPSRPITPTAGAHGGSAGHFRTTTEQQGAHYPYTIQVSSYPDANKAHRVAQGLRNRGDPAFTSPARIPGKGIWHRIFIGYYRDVAEARQTARTLNERRFRKTDVLLKPYALQVGLAHSENQLKQYLADLAKGGYLAYWAPDQNVAGKLRVLLGAYATADEAEAFIAPLRELGFRPIIVSR